jgi:hypothetical protein
MNAKYIEDEDDLDESDFETTIDEANDCPF